MLQLIFDFDILDDVVGKRLVGIEIGNIPKVCCFSCECKVFVASM